MNVGEVSNPDVTEMSMRGKRYIRASLSFPFPYGQILLKKASVPCHLAREVRCSPLSRKCVYYTFYSVGIYGVTWNEKDVEIFADLGTSGFGAGHYRVGEPPRHDRAAGLYCPSGRLLHGAQ